MRNVPTVAPFGTWRSPIAAHLIMESAVALKDVGWAGAHLFWLESRPHEHGRHALMETDLRGHVTERLPRHIDIQSRIQECGGGALALQNDTIYFCNDGDQRVYRQIGLGEPEPLTLLDPNRCYADLVVDTSRQRLLAIREISDRQVIAAIPSNRVNATDQVLLSGHDFYRAPRISPDGRYLAFVAWDLPTMPWDSSHLFVAKFQPDGTLSTPIKIAGGPKEGVSQPQWSVDGQLCFISDRTGWSNLYRWDDGQVHPVTALHAEFKEASWDFGLSSYGFLESGDIIATYSLNGYARFVTINLISREMVHIRHPFTTISQIKAQGNQVAMLAGSDRLPKAVAVYNLDQQKYTVYTRENHQSIVDDDNIALPEPIEFPNEDGTLSYGFYYAPKNCDYTAPEGEKPPTIMVAHNRPTDQCKPEFSLKTQYWTTRGFAVMEVNYGGSTGYGRAYRQRLAGRWGIVDVNDLIGAGTFLARYGKVDLNRLMIRGGYTALAALAFRKVFRAGSIYGGISDLKSIRATLPQVQARYLEALVGSFTEHPDRYHDRSPLAHADRINTPILFLQGLDDAMVSPTQTQDLVDRLTELDLPVAHLMFPGEGHHFSDPETIARCHEAELSFFARVLGIRLPEHVKSFAVNNWSE